MAVKIAVISDTHVGQRISAYPAGFLREIGRCDIAHAGDHTSIASLELLESQGELRAVHGNMDEMAVADVLPAKLTFDVEGVCIGITHGSGAPDGIERRVLEVFDDSQKPDIIIFGHSHKPCDLIIDGVRMINPGSLSGNIGGRPPSWGVLTIDGDNIDWRHIAMR